MVCFATVRPLFDSIQERPLQKRPGTLEEQAAETGARAAAGRVEEHEALEARA